MTTTSYSLANSTPGSFFVRGLGSRFRLHAQPLNFAWKAGCRQEGRGWCRSLPLDAREGHEGLLHRWRGSGDLFGRGGNGLDALFQLTMLVSEFPILLGELRNAAREPAAGRQRGQGQQPARARNEPHPIHIATTILPVGWPIVARTSSWSTRSKTRASSWPRRSNATTVSCAPRPARRRWRTWSVTRSIC